MFQDFKRNHKEVFSDIERTRSEMEALFEKELRDNKKYFDEYLSLAVQLKEYQSEYDRMLGR